MTCSAGGVVYDRAALLDSSGLIAVLDPRERDHDDVCEQLDLMGDRSYALYVTTLVIAETYRRLLFKRNVTKAIPLRFIRDVFDGSYNIIRLDEQDEAKAVWLLERFADQDLTFTDAASMAVMLRLGLRRALTLDWHFSLLGFERIP